MKNNSKKSRNISQSTKIAVAVIITNIALLAIVVISAYKELSLSDAIATAVLYASLMSVACSYWVLMNTANGLSGIGEEIE